MFFFNVQETLRQIGLLQQKAERALKRGHIPSTRSAMAEQKSLLRECMRRHMSPRDAKKLFKQTGRYWQMRYRLRAREDRLCSHTDEMERYLERIDMTNESQRELQFGWVTDMLRMAERDEPDLSSINSEDAHGYLFTYADDLAALQDDLQPERVTWSVMEQYAFLCVTGDLIHGIAESFSDILPQHDTRASVIRKLLRDIDLYGYRTLFASER